MGLFRKLVILKIVTRPTWSPRLVTAGVSILDQRQSVDTWVDTGRFRPRLCENTAEQFKTCGLKQYESIVDFHDRQPSFGRCPSNSNGWAHS